MKIASIYVGTALLASGVLSGRSQADPGQSLTLRLPNIAYYEQGGLVHKAKEGMRDTTDALGITPSVKSAIIADSQLNDRRNHINVGTRDYVVHLTGHVYNQAIRSRASRIALRKLHQMHKNYKVSNELSIVRR